MANTEPDPDRWMEVAGEALEIYERARRLDPEWAKLLDSVRVWARACLKARGVSHWITAAGDAIICVTCGMTSYHSQDVANRYCGNCHVFHDDESA